jgi:branched-chain amino acid aminotransferase
MVCYNGNFLNADQLSISDIKRAFSFGDGLFETVRVANGQPLFLKSHFKRFFKGLDVLKIDHSDLKSKSLIDNIKELLEICNIDKGARLRLSAFRSGEGSYMPESNKISYLIEVFPISHNLYETNIKGYSLDLFKDIPKSINKLSLYKTTNSLVYVLASVYAKENNFDDVFILNDQGNIIESTNSNIFISSNGVLYTPPLSEGCIGGIMRMKLINLAISKGIIVYENKMPPQHLMAADEIIITNTIQGVRWVGKYKEKRYFSSMAKKLNEALNEDIFNYQKDLMEN